MYRERLEGLGHEKLECGGCEYYAVDSSDVFAVDCLCCCGEGGGHYQEEKLVLRALQM